MRRVTEPEGAARRYDGGVPTLPAGEGEAAAVTGPSGRGEPRRRNPVLRGGVVAVAGLLAFAGSASLAPAPASSASGSPSTASAAPGSAPAPASAASSAAPSRTPFLPEPTGSHPVGTTSLYLKDTSRPDPWVPTVKARELMVSLWYPAESPGRRRAQYMTPKESELLLKEGKITGVPLEVLSRTRTNAFTDVKPAGRKRGLPLVVLSPGFTKPRSTLTALAEDLASRGYVVAGIDHTYENVATTFPDGRVTTCVPCEGDHDPSLFTKLSKGRAADVSFVIDQLTGPRPRWKGASLIDPSRIAMAGHSAGGASTIAAMVKDSRLRAGIDIDGTTPTGILDSRLSRPFMFLGKPATYTPGAGGPADTWERDWKLLTGWKRWLLLTGAAHESFTDIMPLADQLGIDSGAELSGVRSLEITRRYVRAFFDLHLLKRAQPLLDKPSARYPEVKLCAPETKTCE
ncbi:alpha/beta hydrolase family protein [Streptosporangium brasiliense]|uniref:Dienelactone hydrolase n=1 Tax=Streptosporangium brasiliense TaxID=47480 RepID=A0ABT9RN44_9ACTN|nr:alpha/beta hydrolase [Streptosporangium brasiliense]MDP9869735.1 putative dienelactone hydrolase [Streptosporangium brasiliense]